MSNNEWQAPRQLAVAEEMDAADVDATALRRALIFIRRVNTLLGYTRATLGHLDRLAANVPADRPLTVLDVATGSADVPAAILAWAKRRGRAVRVVGLDLHERTLAAAAEHVGPAVPLVRGDALALPFAAGSVDVVMTSMFLHHLPTDMAAAALREMSRVARVGIIAADLVRDRRAYRWITLFTLLSPSMIRHDARVSVRQAFTLAEAEALCEAAALEHATVHRHFGHRFVITATGPGLSR